MSYPISATIQTPSVTTPSAARVWIGRALTTIAVLFLLMDATIKVLKLPVAIDSTVQVGYAAGVVLPIGLLELALLVLYLIPRVAPLGAVLWTGYLGGAVATHLRVGDPLFTHVLFPTYVGAMLWAGLWLRDARVRALFSRDSIGSVRL
jgi:hypothetical protein